MRFSMVVVVVAGTTLAVAGCGTDAGSDAVTTRAEPADPARTLEIYVAGHTSSAGMPGALNAYHGGEIDGLLARIDVPLDGSGSTLAWSRYVGGSDFEQVRDVAVDESGRAFLTGRMASTDLGVTPDALQPEYGGGAMDAFLVRVENDGRVGYASYFGGGGYDVGYGISVASDGALILSGRTSSTGLPTGDGAAQARYAGGVPTAPYFGGDFFVFSLDADARTIRWGTYAGGSSDDMGRGRNDVDGTGAVWVGGRTLSTDFPARGTLRGESDAAVIKIAPDGASFTGGAIFGGDGKYDGATGGMCALADGTMLVAGYTSSADFPADADAAQSAHGGGFDGMLVRLSADGGKVLSATYLGGSKYEECQGVNVLPNGDVIAVGMTTSEDFPFTRGALAGPADVWVARLNPDLSTIVWAVPVGASGDEGNDASRIWSTAEGEIVLVGTTTSTDLPVTPDASQPRHGGGGHDMFIAVLSTDGGLLHVSYVGGPGDDFPRSMAFRER